MSCEMTSIHEAFRIPEKDLCVAAHETIRKICYMFEDNTAVTLVHRQCRLIKEFVEICHDGYYLQHIRYIMFVIGQLADKLETVPEFEILLSSMLRICRKPPVLKKASDEVTQMDLLTEYISQLGYLLGSLDAKENLQILLLDAVVRLLTNKRPKDSSYARVHSCNTALERSDFPETLGEMLHVSAPSLYIHLLHLSQVILSASHKIGSKMASQNAVEAIILRLDPDYFEYQNLTPVTDVALKYNESFIALSSSVLWEILRSVGENREEVKVPTPSRATLFCLKHLLRTYCKSIHVGTQLTRNDLCALIAYLLHLFPSLEIVESGLAQEIAMIAVAPEIAVDVTWPSQLVFAACNEDLEFKKILLTCMCYLVKIPAAIKILKTQSVMAGVLHNINPGLTPFPVPWSPTQFWDLMRLSLLTINILIPYLPQEFVDSNGSTRLIMLIEWYMQEAFSVDIIIPCIKCIATMASSGKEILLDDLRSQGTTKLLVRFSKQILSKPILSANHQRLLTLNFYTLEILGRNSPQQQELFGELGVNVMLDVMKHFTSCRQDDAPMDPWMVICAGDCLWECVAWHKKNRNTFCKKSGIYCLLDFIEDATFEIKTVFLGCLIDICEDNGTNLHLITWHGKKGTSLLTVLANAWREEESRTQVLRTSEGCILDVDMPLMGKKQQDITFGINRNTGSSPAMTDLLGSVRPKAFALIQKMRSHQTKITNLAAAFPLREIPLSVQDKITLVLMENFLLLKIHEMWNEVAVVFESTGIKLTSADGCALEALRKTYLGFVQEVREKQINILNSNEGMEEKQESDFYELIRNCHLAPALYALHELEDIVLCSNYEFLAKAKEKQRQEVNANLDKLPAEFSCRTFLEETNVTKFCGRNVLVKSVPDNEPHETEPIQVTPENSHVSTLGCDFSSDSEEEFETA